MNLSPAQLVSTISVTHHYVHNLFAHFIYVTYIFTLLDQPDVWNHIWIMLSWKDWNNKIHFRYNDWSSSIIDRSSNQHSSCHIKWVGLNQRWPNTTPAGEDRFFAPIKGNRLFRPQTIINPNYNNELHVCSIRKSWKQLIRKTNNWQLTFGKNIIFKLFFLLNIIYLI